MKRKRHSFSSKPITPKSQSYQPKMGFRTSYYRSSNAATIGDKACTQLLEAMVEKTKEAVAMDIRLPTPYWDYDRDNCIVSLYYRGNHPDLARSERLRLSAISMSSEQSGTKAIGDSAFWGFERYPALFTLERRFDFVFTCSEFGTLSAESSLSTFARDLGLSIAQHANLVRCLRVEYSCDHRIDAHQFFEDMFSVEGAFPSLRSAYLNVEDFGEEVTDVSPQLMKHVRVLELCPPWRTPPYAPPLLKQVGRMIRNKDNEIEDFKVSSFLLYHEELLDDALRSVRSFRVRLIFPVEISLLAASLERTKADGDKLTRLSLLGQEEKDAGWLPLIETTVRSRPHLQVLELEKLSYFTFNALCDVVAPSVLTTVIVEVYLDDVQAGIEYKTFAEGMGKLLQHPTIRELTIAFSRHYQVEDKVLHDVAQIIAEGLRATHLRKFHWKMPGCDPVGSATATQLCECVRENRNLMDMRLWGGYWGEDRYPCPSIFISLRNQYLSQVLMRDENTVPSGLWPLILKSASNSPFSILYYLLTLKPHLVKGNVKRIADVDIEKCVDDPSPKRTRAN